MSDPVANVDIEDVLSSIRRLVSDEHRQHEEHAEDAAVVDQNSLPEEIAPQADGARLLLTPALRIDMPQEDEVLEDNSAAQEDASDEDASDEEVAEAAEAENADESQDVSHEDASVWDEYAADNANESNDDAHDETAVEAADPEAEDSPDEQAMEWSDVTDDDNVVAFFASSPAVAAEAYEEENDKELEDEREVAAQSVLDAHASPLSEMLADETAQHEPVEELDYDPENEFLSDEMDGADEDSLFDDATIMDEDALRELVSQLVREELQGALGERITRNVRKLVRREIQRALVSKDLE